ncbi:hypothetical protein [Cellulophaga baltica]|uniref:hypothetical protein n=1 Tax=Cellulophaga baltica TaxID=76594 RepID=UPI002494C519|nr:hypothetical protein [Cellulophaga baltica]
MRILYLFFLLFSFGILFLRAQNNSIHSDSIVTPFREGRWLTGLSGSISSNSNKIKSSEEKTITNEFGINLSTGKFIKDRWLLGGKLNLDRASSSNSVDRTTESLYVGPYVSYYLGKNSRGSLFTTLSTGYVRYREETSLYNLASPVTEIAEGGGFGTLFGLGYSYVINDQIAFDIGFDLNIFWVGINQEQQPSGTIGSESLTVSNTAFTFGFNVILDDFFF